jgi:S1-C subfamily serine protease
MTPGSRLTFFFCLLTLSLSLPAQDAAEKAYFDKSGKTCTAEQAYYYRTGTDSGGFYKCFYISNDKPYFSGQLLSVSPTDESGNTYSGTCRWYYRNGNLKSTRSFNASGAEDGVSKFYFESGKIWKEIEYENGKMKGGTYLEYNEDGSRSRIFEEDFRDNANEWDLYTSDKSSATINAGFLEMASLTKEGTSRYINRVIESDEYSVEAVLDISTMKENEKAGIIFGFRDWQNYHYYAVTKKTIYIGSFYEGVKSISLEGMYTSALNASQPVSLKIICNGEKIFYSVNGELQYKEKIPHFYGNNIGFIAAGKSKFKADRLQIKEMNLSGRSGSPTTSAADKDVRVTGSGVLISANGYVLTNHHVIENSTRFVIELGGPSGRQNYQAEVVAQDKDNDLAILKVKDPQFTGFPLRYAFKESGFIDVGSQVFTIGYPHALSGMGKDPKFTDGKISSKTGYNGSVNAFQTTIPVQPGNSGGPVFNESGQLIGVINATFRQADNVSYAIKLNYIKNLIELLSEQVDIPVNNPLSALSLEEKLKVLTDYVVLVKVK